MVFGSIFAEVFLLIIFTFLVFNFLTDFGVKKKKGLIFIVPLLTYVVGFSLRLSSIKGLVDLGFFLTEFSTIFVTVLFTLCLYLGQVRYWRIK
jgi:hypothetical protein